MIAEYPEPKQIIVENVLVAQGEEAEPFLDLIRDEDPMTALELLVDDCYYPGQHELSEISSSYCQNKLEVDGWIMSWSFKLQFISIEKEYVEEDMTDYRLMELERGQL